MSSTTIQTSITRCRDCAAWDVTPEQRAFPVTRLGMCRRWAPRGGGGMVVTPNISMVHDDGCCEGIPLPPAHPLPKLTRPRVVVDPEHSALSWRAMAGGRLESATTGRENWSLGFAASITPARVAMWADLLANPTEEVEA